MSVCKKARGLVESNIHEKNHDYLGPTDITQYARILYATSPLGLSKLQSGGSNGHAILPFLRVINGVINDALLPALQLMGGDCLGS